MDIILVYTEGVLKPSKNGKGRRQEGFIKKQFSKNSWNIGKMQNRYRAWWAKGKTGILYRPDINVPIVLKFLHPTWYVGMCTE